MAEIVLRLRLLSGERMDVKYDEPDTPERAQVVEHALATLAEDDGMLRCVHGERLHVVYGRGVAEVEVSPRGAVL